MSSTHSGFAPRKRGSVLVQGQDHGYSDTPHRPSQQSDLRGEDSLRGDLDKNYVDWAWKSIGRLNEIDVIQEFARDFILSCQDPNEISDKDTIFNKIVDCR